MKLDAAMEVDRHAKKLCAGGGTGAFILSCVEILMTEVDASSTVTGDLNTDFVNNEGRAFLSNEFSIPAWSCTTSDDPAK